MEDKYVRMVKKMNAKRKGDPFDSAQGEPYTAYIVRCADGSLYTGIAKDVEARVKKHNSGKGAAYTRTRRPVTLLYQESCRDRSAALMREIQIKRLPKEKKEQLASPPPPLTSRACSAHVEMPAREVRGTSPKRGGKILGLVLFFTLAPLSTSPTLGEDGRRPGEGDTVLSVLPQGWEVDTIEEAGRGTLPRVAWSRDVNTVVYVAVSGARRKVAVNDRFLDADQAGPLGFTPDGLEPVFTTRSGGAETLHVGAKTFGPYGTIERPALSSDGAHIAFVAKEGKSFIAVQDGKVLARAPYVGAPVLDASGDAAFWTAEDKRWTLVWKGRPAPGTPLTGHAPNASQPDVSQPVFSPDGTHVAFSRRRPDGRYTVVRDGAEGAPYLAVGDPVFSPDSASMAYGASAGPDFELNTLVVDDRTITEVQPKGRPPLAVRSLWGYRFLRDGRLTWFATVAGGRSCFLLGDETSAEFESVSQPAFDPGNRRAAFAAFQDNKSRAVVDGEPGPPYDSVTFLQFDVEGKRFAYTAKAGTSSVVVLDGAPGEPFDEVGWVRFTPGGKGIAYWARTGARWQTVVDGEKRDTSIRADMIGNLILAGPDGSVPVYSVREQGAWYLLAGPRKAGPFDAIGAFTADADPATVACGTREGREFHRRQVALTGAR